MSCQMPHTCHISYLFMISYETTISIYICLISTKWNQQCDQEHWYTYALHYWHMPPKYMPAKFAHISPLHCYYSLYIDSTLLHMLVTTKKTSQLLCYCHICASNKYALQMYQWKQYVNMCHI